MRSSHIAAFTLILGLAVPATQAQQQFVYPAKGQTAEQQKKDEYECHSWAVEQTGFDPTQATAPVATTPAAPAPSTGRAAMKGAATGAVVAAATDNNAGTAAVAGAMVGGAAKRNAANQSARQSQQQAAQQQSALKANYQRARSACLEGRGYSIK